MSGGSIILNNGLIVRFAMDENFLVCECYDKNNKLMERVSTRKSKLIEYIEKWSKL